MNLLDAIRGNKPAGVTDETSKLRQLLGAKSGKQVGAGDVGSSNLQEQQAVAATNEQLGQLNTEAQIQSESLNQQQAGLQQKQEIAEGEIATARKFDTVQTRLQTEKLLQDLERDKGKIDVARDKARLEQVGSQLRLQSQQYTDNLEREGARARLDNATSFSEELQKDLLGESKDLLKKQFKNDKILNADQREFDKQLAQMNIDLAWQLLQQEQAAAKQRAMWEGVGNITQAGVGAYGTFANSPSKPAPQQQATYTGDASSTGIASRTV